jgi:serine/threonine protein kinase
MHTIVADIIDGVSLLHSLGIAHHDLSLENVLINRTTGRATIIDLGMVVKVPLCQQQLYRPKIAPAPRWPCRCPFSATAARPSP